MSRTDLFDYGSGQSIKYANTDEVEYLKDKQYASLLIPKMVEELFDRKTFDLLFFSEQTDYLYFKEYEFFNRFWFASAWQLLNQPGNFEYTETRNGICSRYCRVSETDNKVVSIVQHTDFDNRLLFIINEYLSNLNYKQLELLEPEWYTRVGLKVKEIIQDM